MALKDKHPERGDRLEETTGLDPDTSRYFSVLNIETAIKLGKDKRGRPLSKNQLESRTVELQRLKRSLAKDNVFIE